MGILVFLLIIIQVAMIAVGIIAVRRIQLALKKTTRTIVVLGDRFRQELTDLMLLRAEVLQIRERVDFFEKRFRETTDGIQEHVRRQVAQLIEPKQKQVESQIERTRSLVTQVGSLVSDVTLGAERLERFLETVLKKGFSDKVRKLKEELTELSGETMSIEEESIHPDGLDSSAVPPPDQPQI